MATPYLVRHRLEGSLGEILLDVRAPRGKHPRPAVIVVHGLNGFKDWGFFPPFAARVARAGFTAVTYNASGSGVDQHGNFTRLERLGRDTCSAALHDLERVLHAVVTGSLLEAPATSVALLGHSRGGGIAVLQAARTERVSALVTWSAISSSHRGSEESRHQDSLAIQHGAGKIHVPWLIVHGEADETVDPREAQVLAAAAPSAQLLIIPRAGHTYGAVHPFAGLTPALQLVFDRTVGFLTAHLV